MTVGLNLRDITREDEAILRLNDVILYKNIPKKLEVGRYHSWVVSTDLPEVLEVTSVDENGEIMSLRHKEYDVRAVQYHPESILTPLGKQILKNWVEA